MCMALSAGQNRDAACKGYPISERQIDSSMHKAHGIRRSQLRNKQQSLFSAISGIVLHVYVYSAPTALVNRYFSRIGKNLQLGDTMTAGCQLFAYLPAPVGCACPCGAGGMVTITSLGFA